MSVYCTRHSSYVRVCILHTSFQSYLCPYIAHVILVMPVCVYCTRHSNYTCVCIYCTRHSNTTIPVSVYYTRHPTQSYLCLYITHVIQPNHTCVCILYKSFHFPYKAYTARSDRNLASLRPRLVVQYCVRFHWGRRTYS